MTFSGIYNSTHQSATRGPTHYSSSSSVSICTDLPHHGHVVGTPSVFEYSIVNSASQSSQIISCSSNVYYPNGLVKTVVSSFGLTGSNLYADGFHLLNSGEPAASLEPTIFS